MQNMPNMAVNVTPVPYKTVVSNALAMAKSVEL